MSASVCLQNMSTWFLLCGLGNILGGFIFLSVAFLTSFVVNFSSFHNCGLNTSWGFWCVWLVLKLEFLPSLLCFSSHLFRGCERTFFESRLTLLISVSFAFFTSFPFDLHTFLSMLSSSPFLCILCFLLLRLTQFFSHFFLLFSSSPCSSASIVPHGFHIGPDRSVLFNSIYHTESNENNNYMYYGLTFSRFKMFIKTLDARSFWLGSHTEKLFTVSEMA